jgi:hypothetical protein
MGRAKKVAPLTKEAPRLRTVKKVVGAVVAETKTGRCHAGKHVVKVFGLLSIFYPYPDARVFCFPDHMFECIEARPIGGRWLVSLALAYVCH